MRAIKYGTTMPLLQNLPVPTANSNQVLIKVHAAGLNPVDAKYVVGDKLPSKHLTNMLRSVYISNKIPGFDFSGTVVQASNGFNVGDAVFGTVPPFCGTLAEYLVAPVDQIYYKPQALSFQEAAALPLVGLTALQCLEDHVTSNISVLVIGASGGTGHVAVQVAKALGVKHITAVCSERSAQFCRVLGADGIIDYQNDLVQQLREQNRQYGVIMDCVTSADPRDTAPYNYPQLLQGADISATASKPPSWLTPNYIYRRLGGATNDWIYAGLERTMGISCWNKHEKLFWIRFPKSAGELKQLAEWADKKLLAPKISKQCDFTAEGVKEAMDLILERRVHGKVVVNILS
jgi:NADPH:quinone reductase-like Zn-dependent oxidoreductase